MNKTLFAATRFTPRRSLCGAAFSPVGARPFAVSSDLLPRLCPALLLVAVLALAAAFSCAAIPGTALAQQEPAPAQPQSTAAAAPAVLPEPPMLPPVRLKVTATRQTVLSSQMSGRLSELAVRDGDPFAKGQILARMDCAMQNAQLARAEAAVQKHKSLYENTMRLAELNSRTSLEVAMVKADLDQASAEAQAARTMVNRCTVRSPFAGRVAERMAQENQFVTEGQPLFEILDPSELELEFIAPSSWLPWFAPGYTFSVRIDETGQSYNATLTRLSGKVDAVSQSIKAYARLENQSPDLLPGMSGEAFIAPPAVE